MTYLLSLSLLVGSPESELLFGLLKDRWNITSAHWWLDAHGVTIFHNRWWEDKFSWSRSSGRCGTLSALLAFLAASTREVVLFLLLNNLHALDSGVINGSLWLSRESAWR